MNLLRFLNGSVQGQKDDVSENREHYEVVKVLTKKKFNMKRENVENKGELATITISMITVFLILEHRFCNVIPHSLFTAQY